MEMENGRSFIILQSTPSFCTLLCGVFLCAARVPSSGGQVFRGYPSYIV